MVAWVVSLGGQKGGTGKSTVAQGLVVEAERAGVSAILADMDETQQTSLRWAERRKQAGIKPKIDARLMRKIMDIGDLALLCDLLVVDTPARADENVLTLARLSHLMVIPTGTNIFELEPAVMLMHKFWHCRIEPPQRLALALNKVLDDESDAGARAYLSAAGYEALPLALKFNAATQAIGNQGRAVTESGDENAAEQGRDFFAGISQALDRSRQAMQKEREREAARKRDKGRGR
jgi:chromosome partitioning protein